MPEVNPQDDFTLPNITKRALALAACFGLLLSFVIADAAFQPVPGQGDLFLTQVAPEPDGALLAPLDIALSLYARVLSNLSFPESLLCHNGRLYLTETFSNESVGGAADIILHQPQRFVESPERTFQRVLRVEQDGSGKRFIVEWDDKTLLPSTLALAENGDLFVGTTSEDGATTQGVWRIADADNTNSGFEMPEQILPPDRFQTPSENTSYSVRPVGFLTHGPHTGDLLIIDAPVQSFVPGGQIWRALAPDFTTMTPFVLPFNDPQTQRPFKPASLAVTPQGDVLVTDFANDKILRFAPDGAPAGVFLERLKSPNQIDVGPDGTVYVTNTEFRGQNVTGGLFVYDPMGQLLAKDTSPTFLRGISICG